KKQGLEVRDRAKTGKSGVRYKLTQAGSVYAGNDLEPPGAVKLPSSFSGDEAAAGPPRAPSILSR
ncbi:MAG: hypothetical protein NUW37_06040, partial [Planctomycetes bacterium]|nr:hypothetical protein [Planctomycetota bacterium]